MSNLTPRRIVGGFNRREASAIIWVYDEYYPYVLGIVKKLTGNSADSEDLCRDIFVKLLGNPGRFNELRKIELFLYNTARNISLNYLRHQQIIKDKSADIERHLTEISESSLTLAEISASLTGMIYKAIEKLPPQTKRIFILHYIQKLENDEIAKQLGISERTVANYKAIALRKLRMEIPKKRSLSSLLLLYFLL